ncbi:H-type small acid-soluble spore protein [Sporosalibacterium faouarense]|uniref:H-type small acid-soluble spore protein n=1 Tax=Sporosalibacterium faouarense TaxID=516123 RepID=UPI00141C3570|nr:H-type small acid-soluble spore protein [Sporosalibacterium faouarense]MTI46453.1 H-type small acid-soluble spore protein [Bacillota bacterium]
MDISRAKNIINSNVEIEVFYNDDSVWIKNLDESSGIAHVESLRNNTDMEVPISDLREINS